MTKKLEELLNLPDSQEIIKAEQEKAESKEKAITRAWLRTKANSIEGGTSEVQLNVIAKRVLDLPA